jgi:hypothetical protein
MKTSGSRSLDALREILKDRQTFDFVFPLCNFPANIPMTATPNSTTPRSEIGRIVAKMRASKSDKEG